MLREKSRNNITHGSVDVTDSRIGSHYRGSSSNGLI